MPTSRGLKKLEPRPFEEQPPFEQRIRLISEEFNVDLSAIGIESGLSHETVRSWIVEARERQVRGDFEPPGYRKSLARVANRWNVPVAWLRDPAPLKKGARLPGAARAKADPGDDAELLDLLRRAVEILERRAKR